MTPSLQQEKYNVPAKQLPLTPHEKLKDKDFRSSFHWRVFRIIAEFVDGWQFLADLKKSVTFFGSARTQEGTQWYEEARKLGHLLAKDGYDVITCGGPGVMEAANRGAWEANEETTNNGSPNDSDKIGKSIGLNIKLPLEQRINKYVDKSVAFHYFFVRKVMLSYYAQAYIYFPGGYGTMDEVFELLTLIQTKKVPPIPVILIGKDFWGTLASWLENEVCEKHHALDHEDLLLYKIVDSAEEAFEIIKNSPVRNEF